MTKAERKIVENWLRRLNMANNRCTNPIECLMSIHENRMFDQCCLSKLRNPRDSHRSASSSNKRQISRSHYFWYCRQSDASDYTDLYNLYSKSLVRVLARMIICLGEKAIDLIRVHDMASFKKKRRQNNNRNEVAIRSFDRLTYPMSQLRTPVQTTCWHAQYIWR